MQTPLKQCLFVCTFGFPPHPPSGSLSKGAPDEGICKHPDALRAGVCIAPQSNLREDDDMLKATTITSNEIGRRYTRGTVAERLLANSVVSDGHGNPSQPKPCLLSTYTKNSYGYGMVRVDGRTTRAHIEAYKAWVGNIPAGMKVMHLCNVPACFEPTHLKVGTQKENLEYMAACGRSSAGKARRNGNYPRGEQHRSHVRPESVRRGERCNLSRLTVTQVQEIRNRREHGATLRAIASEFGVSNVTVWNIVKSKTWAHVQEAI